MLLPVFHDLVKPQWRAVLEELKLVGECAASDLARATGGSYMAVKTHCEELVNLGYLIRTRSPRTEVGRPEIFYSLASKSDLLFPEAGGSFSLELLDHIRRIFGESAPDKLLFQYFQQQGDSYAKQLAKCPTPTEKAIKLCALREKQGYAGCCEQPAEEVLRIVERHNPLHRIFAQYPRAATMEWRMLEQVIGCKLNRREHPAGRQTTPHVIFEIS